MKDFEKDIEPAIPTASSKVENRKENTALMEPLLIAEGSRHRTGLTDLAVELAARSAGFTRSLPPGVHTALATLLRTMNCYYSANLIEGHNTHPVDIERALKGDYSTEPEIRSLQLEAEAHIAVQEWIDDGGIEGRAVTAGALMEIHRRFCERLPEELLWVEGPDTRPQNSSSGSSPARCAITTSRLASISR